LRAIVLLPQNKPNVATRAKDRLTLLEQLQVLQKVMNQDGTRKDQSKWKVKGLRLQLLRMQKVMNQNGPRNRAAVIFGPGPVQRKWKQKGTCTGPALSTTLVEIHMDMVNLVLFIMYTIILH
jgi:hypothetical protein